MKLATLWGPTPSIAPLVWIVPMSLVPVLPAYAHEVRPAYLQITQIDTARYSILWKQPTLGESAIRLVPHLSNGWLEKPPESQYAAPGFRIRTWRVDSAEPLSGITLDIEGLEHTITDVLVRIQLMDHNPTQVILRPEEPQFRIPSSTSKAITKGNPLGVFLVHGVQHIFAGMDHLLFVLGLLLIARNFRTLLEAMTAFTVSHSLTLACAMITHAELPSTLIETLIAMSILVLGMEIIHAERGESSLTIRRPGIVAFVFGLFHGLGFANGLADLGFARHDLFTALLSFNSGVELGQLTFVALVLLTRSVLVRLSNVSPTVLTRTAAYVIGITGAAWTFQRGAMLLGVLS